MSAPAAPQRDSDPENQYSKGVEKASSLSAPDQQKLKSFIAALRTRMGPNPPDPHSYHRILQEVYRSLGDSPELYDQAAYARINALLEQEIMYRDDARQARLKKAEEEVRQQYESYTKQKAELSEQEGLVALRLLQLVLWLTPLGVITNIFGFSYPDVLTGLLDNVFSDSSLISKIADLPGLDTPGTEASKLIDTIYDAPGSEGLKTITEPLSAVHKSLGEIPIFGNSLTANPLPDGMSNFGDVLDATNLDNRELLKSIIPDRNLVRGITEVATLPTAGPFRNAYGIVSPLIGSAALQFLVAGGVSTYAADKELAAHDKRKELRESHKKSLDHIAADFESDFEPDAEKDYIEGLAKKTVGELEAAHIEAETAWCIHSLAYRGAPVELEQIFGGISFGNPPKTLEQLKKAGKLGDELDILEQLQASPNAKAECIKRYMCFSAAGHDFQIFQQNLKQINAAQGGKREQLQEEMIEPVRQRFLERTASDRDLTSHFPPGSPQRSGDLKAKIELDLYQETERYARANYNTDPGPAPAAPQCRPISRAAQQTMPSHKSAGMVQGG